MKTPIKTTNVGLLLTFIFAFSCSYNKPSGEADSAYHQEINDWRNGRIEALKNPEGWLSLIGLFTLEEGENSFGASLANVIVFPTDKAPEVIGSFVLTDEQVRVQINAGLEVLHQGEPVSDMIMLSDATGDPTILTLGSLKWYIIKRGDIFAVRLKDSESVNIQAFEGIDSYPIDLDWRIEAHFRPFDTPKTMEMPTFIGTVAELTSPGILEFEIDGQTHQLDAYAEPEDDEFWLIFGDRTNGKETYGGGRFLVVDKPGTGQTTYIDFNYAYNPPCAFSDFATCPLPTARNRLAVEVTAGEKNYEHGSH
ncbi:MAG: DUF1684 domain-containing protein [Candidatus Neomarinimicrobiota bacterium]